MLGYISAAFVEYRREFDDLMLLANLMGGVSFLLFGIYGRWFYCDVAKNEKPFFSLMFSLPGLIFDSVLCFCGCLGFHMQHGHFY